MIIAILEDNKGFRASYDFAIFKSRIEIPIRPKIRVVDTESILKVPSLDIKKATFDFYKWLEKGKIALYREA